MTPQAFHEAQALNLNVQQPHNRNAPQAQAQPQHAQQEHEPRGDIASKYDYWLRSLYRYLVNVTEVLGVGVIHARKLRRKGYRRPSDLCTLLYTQGPGQFMDQLYQWRH